MVLELKAICPRCGKVFVGKNGLRRYVYEPCSWRRFDFKGHVQTLICDKCVNDLKMWVETGK